MKSSIRKLAVIGISAAMFATSAPIGAMAASVYFNVGPGYGGGYSGQVWGGNVRYPRSYGYSAPSYRQCWRWEYSYYYGVRKRQKVFYPC